MTTVDEPAWMAEAAWAIRERLDDLGDEGRDDEGRLDGSLWLDGVESAAEDLARTVAPIIRRAVLEEAGPCAVECPFFFASTPTVWCRLVHGHAGDHISDEGTRWRDRAKGGSE